jgi:carboxyl-terminal processing protease
LVRTSSKDFLMKTRKFGILSVAVALALVLCTQSSAQTPTPAPSQPQVPSLHELLQGMKFPLAVPVPEKPDPMRLYKEAIETIAKQHIALAGYAEPEPTAIDSMVNGWFGRPTKPRKTKMDAFLEKWGNPPRELKSLDDADTAIQEALKDLDFRFDSYLVPKDVKLEDKRIDNTNIGIGIILKLEGMQDLLKGLPKDATEEQVDKVLIISEKNFLSVNPVRNSPAAKGGMLEGDVIKEVGGKAILGMPYTEVMKLIKGKKGTKVDITVERVENGNKVTKKLTITRDEYEVPVVTLKHLGNDVWHLHLETFAARNAAKDVKEALDEVVKKGGKALIFDLRDNGGGLVDQAIDIAMYMLPEGTIVTQQHRLFGGAGVVETQSHVTTHVMLETRPQPSGNMPIVKPRVLAVPAEMPIVVLVNGHSASASELVSGCLKFNKRVKLVGVRTFGKGVGQALLDLPYGRRLHVTSFYFLPAGRFTDWVGIEVDVESKMAEDAKKDTQLDDAVKVVTEMYEAGVKERADTLKREEEIRQENRELWKKRIARQKEMEAEFKKKEAERLKKEEEKKNAPKDGDKPASEGGAKEAPKPGTNDGASEGTTPDTTTAPGSTPEVVTPPAPTLPENGTAPANPLIDPNPAKKPGTP